MCQTNFILGKIDKWLCANKLYFSISKSQFCIFSKTHYNNSSALQLRGQVLRQCSHIKFLVMFIDDKLSFSAHITTVCNKISCKIGFINKLSDFNPKKPLHCVYYTLIYILI